MRLHCLLLLLISTTPNFKGVKLKRGYNKTPKPQAHKDKIEKSEMERRIGGDKLTRTIGETVTACGLSIEC